MPLSWELWVFVCDLGKLSGTVLTANNPVNKFGLEQDACGDIWDDVGSGKYNKAIHMCISTQTINLRPWWNRPCEASSKERTHSCSYFTVAWNLELAISLRSVRRRCLQKGL